MQNTPDPPDLLPQRRLQQHDTHTLRKLAAENAVEVACRNKTHCQVTASSLEDSMAAQVHAQQARVQSGTASEMK